MLVAHEWPTFDTLVIPFPLALFPEEILYHQQSDTDNSNNLFMKDGFVYWNAALQLREEYLRFIRVLKSTLSIHFKNFYAHSGRFVSRCAVYQAMLQKVKQPAEVMKGCCSLP